MTTITTTPAPITTGTTTTTSSGIPSGPITSSGLGSGLDITGLVTKLVAAEGDPQTALMTRKTATLQADLSSWGLIQSALSTLQTSAQALSSASSFQPLAATSSNTTAFTATTDGSAVAANYPVEVTALAQPATSRTGSFTNATTLVGAGTLDINLGSGTPFTITTDATTTLSAVRDAINNSTTNPGIQATIIQVDNGAQLVLSSSVMGAANSIGIVATPNPASSATPPLDLSRFSTANLTSIQSATDASITIAGQTVTRQSNTFSDVIPGVTFSLLAPTTTPASLTIAANSSAALTNVQSFISSYNALVSTITSQTSYDSASNTGAPLSGNATVRILQRQINQALSNAVPGGTKGYSTLADIGITRDKTGALQLNTSKFTVAMTLSSDSVSNIFTSKHGLAASLNTVLSNSLNSGGILSSTVSKVNTQISKISTQQAALQVRLNLLTARYTAQFTAMDNLMGKMTSTATFLTQTFYKATTN
jgi:flagellar hook-associated protein 2